MPKECRRMQLETPARCSFIKSTRTIAVLRPHTVVIRSAGSTPARSTRGRLSHDHVESQICYNMKGTANQGATFGVGKKTESKSSSNTKTARFARRNTLAVLTTASANQMLSKARVHIWVALDQSKDQHEQVDRHGNSGCTLTVNGEELSMCSMR